jgi:hypothetical protein
LKLLQAEPIISNQAQLTARRSYSPEGEPGILSLIKLLNCWFPEFDTPILAFFQLLDKCLDIGFGLLIGKQPEVVQVTMDG